MYCAWAVRGVGDDAGMACNTGSVPYLQEASETQYFGDMTQGPKIFLQEKDIISPSEVGGGGLMQRGTCGSRYT